MAAKFLALLADAVSEARHAADEDEADEWGSVDDEDEEEGEEGEENAAASANGATAAGGGGAGAGKPTGSATAAGMMGMGDGAGRGGGGTLDALAAAVGDNAADDDEEDEGCFGGGGAGDPLSASLDLEACVRAALRGVAAEGGGAALAALGAEMTGEQRSTLTALMA